MTPPADVDVVRTLLARATRRVRLILGIHGITAGFAVALALVAIEWLAHAAFVPLVGASLVLVALGIGVGIARGSGHRARIAAIVERRAPQCRNVLITAGELIERRAGIDPYVRELVFRDAAHTATSLDLARIFPLRNAVTAMIAAAALWTVVVTRPVSSRTAAAIEPPATSSSATASISAITVEMTDPAYLGGATRTARDPVHLEVPSGSRLRVTVHADASTVTAEDLAAKRTLKEIAPRIFAGDFVSDTDGFLALEPAFPGGRVGARHLITITAIADLPPVVRITAPGKDQKFADGRQTIDVAIEATDDHALASLRLHYTRVAGSGERYTFTEGDVPLAITRADARHWTARAAWRLDSLALGPGDMVVYRAEAADGRPGAAPAESDAYIAEVLAPGGVAETGFALDPEVERYALSEQMVILKTERLLAGKPSLPADSFADGAADIALEQRRVRAEYVFMMGGEVGGADDGLGDLNEEAETSGEGDLAVQRMLNQGRAALLGAIRAMSRAATALTVPNLPDALIDEKTALAQLELTFAHTKIILRALTEHERLDPTRRLSGVLTDAARDTRPLDAREASPRVIGLEHALGGIIALAADSGADRGAKTSALAEQLMRVDPSSIAIQQVAAQLDSAATATTRHGQSSALLDRAAEGVTQLLRAELLPAASSPADVDGRTPVELLHRPRP